VRLHAEPRAGRAERRPLSERAARGHVPRRGLVQEDRVPGTGAGQEDGGGRRGRAAGKDGRRVHPRGLAERARPSELAVRPDRRHGRVHMFQLKTFSLQSYCFPCLIPAQRTPHCF